MLNLDFIKHTKVYQEAKEEGKQEAKQKILLEVVPKLLQRGLSLQ
ncbi:hypothetical protein [Tolypothrix sp. VBCCA 56010]